MLPAAVRTLLARDLRTLAREVSAYPSDELLWRTVPGIANPGGTLALHMIGNVQHFIGAVLAGNGFVRDREAEFATRDLTRAEVSARIASAAKSVDGALAQITPEQWASAYPIGVGGRRLGTAEFVEHLVAHFAYHLGQMDYHRRMVGPESGTVDAMSLKDLGESDA